MPINEPRSGRKPVSFTPLRCLQLDEGRNRPPLVWVLVYTGPTSGPDPAPSPDDDGAAEQIPLDLKGIEPSHVPGGIDPLERCRCEWECELTSFYDHVTASEKGV